MGTLVTNSVRCLKYNFKFLFITDLFSPVTNRKFDKKSLKTTDVAKELHIGAIFKLGNKV